MKRKKIKRLAVSILLIAFLLQPTAVGAMISTDPPDIIVTPEEERAFPYDVVIQQDSTDINKSYITKFYKLPESEAASKISTKQFEQDGFQYVLMDIVRNDVTDVSTKTGKKNKIIESESDKMEDILKLLPLEIDFSAKGYTGKIPLDVSSIKVESKGTGYGTGKVSAYREFPSLSSNDTSLISKSVVEKGVTCTLDDVTWKSVRLDDIDADEIVTSYTAYANYTGTYSYSYSKGYTVTALYKGSVTKTETGQAIFEARFTGYRAVPIVAEVEEIADDETAGLDEIEVESKNIVLPIIIVLLALIFIAGIIYMFLRQEKKIKKLIKANNQNQTNYESEDFNNDETSYSEFIDE